MHSLNYVVIFNNGESAVCSTISPPRFLLLVELRALPCPSVLLLPTQPPITVPMHSTTRRKKSSVCLNHICQTDEYKCLKMHNVIMLDGQTVNDDVKLGASCEKASSGNNDSSALLVPVRSDKLRCLRHVYCQLTGTRAWTSCHPWSHLQFTYF